MKKKKKKEKKVPSWFMTNLHFHEENSRACPKRVRLFHIVRGRDKLCYPQAFNYARETINRDTGKRGC